MCKGRRKKLTDALRWHLKWADKVEWLEDMSAESGTTLKALLDRPQLAPDLEWVFDAFWDLSGDRQCGFAMGPIMWASIDSWCRRHRIAGAAFDRLHWLLRQLDREYLVLTVPPKQPGTKA